MEHSAVWEIAASQLGWIARFVLTMGAVGLLVWWAREVIGFDLEKDINAIERLAQKGADDGDVKKFIPLLLVLISGAVMAAYLLGGFIH